MTSDPTAGAQGYKLRIFCPTINELVPRLHDRVTAAVAELVAKSGMPS